MELALGIIGTILGVVSIAWQAHTWRESGARIAVEGVLFAEGSESPVLKVEVRNKGRGTCELRSVYLLNVTEQDGFDPSRYRIGDGPTLPSTLGPGQCVVLNFRASAIARALAHHGDTAWTARIHARLGDGSEVRSNGSLTITEELSSEDEFAVDHGDGIKQVHVYGSTAPVRTVPQRRRIFRLLRL